MSQFHKNIAEIRGFLDAQNTFIKGNFDKQKVDNLPLLVKSMTSKRPEVMKAFEYTRDCEKVYFKIVKKFQTDQLSNESNLH